MTFLAGICLGVLIGLVIGPDSEREHAANVDGWIEGYRQAQETSNNALATARQKDI